MVLSSTTTTTTTTTAIVCVVAVLATSMAAAATTLYLVDKEEDSYTLDTEDRTGGDSSKTTTTSSGTRTPSTATTAYQSLIGHTPLLPLHNLSRCLQGRQIYVKMESCNPGGTGKDRAALGMIQAAQDTGDLPPAVVPSVDATTHAGNKTWSSSSLSSTYGTKTSPSHPVTLSNQAQAITGRASKHAVETNSIDESIHQAMVHSRTGGLVIEGTSGSTGIALATISKSFGHACLVVMPDDQAMEKQTILRTMGAVVHVVPNAAISNPNHYVNIARKIAERARNVHNIKAVFTDQFENPANYWIHYSQTGPEIFQQCPDLSAFVMSAGTGGTISGVGNFLKEQRPTVRMVLVDPPGSALFHKIEHGVAYAPQQREQTIKRHRYDTLAEGIGLDRITHNFALGCNNIDTAIRVSDQEAVDMAHWLLNTEGLWVGSSSAMNVVGAIRTALSLPPGPSTKVVTVICDGGTRHVTRFWNREFCTSWGLRWPLDTPEDSALRIPECLRHCFKK